VSLLVNGTSHTGDPSKGFDTACDANGRLELLVPQSSFGGELSIHFVERGEFVTVRPQRLLEQRAFAPGALSSASAGQSPVLPTGGGAAGDVLSFAEAARALNDPDAFELTLATYAGHFVCAEQGGGASWMPRAPPPRAGRRSPSRQPTRAACDPAPA
jgi:hypothetical protein